MPTFSGMVHDFLFPTPIVSAEVDTSRLTIRHGSWVYEATSRDGFYYEGNYGNGHADPDRFLKCWLYSGPDGSKILYTYWHHRQEKQTQGESVFRLVPAPPSRETCDQIPEDWTLVRQTLERQKITGTALELLLIHDRWTGYRAHESALAQPGLYALFYASGKLARIGQASRSLAQRLPDYEPHASGWFCYRWLGVIPVLPEQKEIITPLENYLLASLNPPENIRGVERAKV